MSEFKPHTSYVIELGTAPLYWSGKDWCNNYEHAKRFSTMEDACAKQATLKTYQGTRVNGHCYASPAPDLAVSQGEPSKLCREGKHEWCMNRSPDESHCACECHRIAQVRARGGEVNNAILDVIRERERQQSQEGWTTAHDDEHANGDLCRAAACYALWSCPHYDTRYVYTPEDWPWTPGSWKPTNARRNLVKAAALLVAEIERLDRIAQSEPGEAK